MIAWMAAKSDQPDYGEVIVYKLAKERLIYGPAQIEAQIDQDTEISRQLSLWDQHGSQVIRGNLMIVPVKNSFLYVEPVFLIAEDVNIPQLQRVIVSYGDEIAMERTLQRALNVIFGQEKGTVLKKQEIQTMEGPVKDPVSGKTGRPALQIDPIKQAWDNARNSMQNENWKEFGQAMEELGQAIEEEYEKIK
jgi:uncharacterized membrane protein (UPF0182 family)